MRLELFEASEGYDEEMHQLENEVFEKAMKNFKSLA